MDEKHGKSQAQIWGQLGGRPKIDNKKKMQINIRFTLDEYNILLQKAKEKNIHTSEYCRILLNEKELPNYKQNKTLIKYADNFSKIKNYMQMGIFNEYEKKRLISEIELTILEIRNVIRWL